MLPPARALTPADEAERLAALRRYGVLGTPPEAAFSRLADLVREAFGTAGVLLSFVGERRVYYKAQRGANAPSYPRAQALCSYAAFAAGPLVLGDALAVPEAAALAFVRRNGVRFYAGVPLRSPEGAPLGALGVFDPAPRAPDGVPLALLGEYAGAVMDLLAARRSARDLLEARPPLISLSANRARRGAPPPVPAAQADARLADLLASTGLYTLATTAAGAPVHLSPALQRVLGYDAPPESLAGLVPAASRGALEAALADTLTAGRARLETDLVTRAGQPEPFALEFVRHPDEPVVGVLARDRRAEAGRAAFETRRAEVLELTARGAPLPAVLLELTRLLETTLPETVAAVFLRDGDGGRLQLEVAPGLPSAFARLVGDVPLAAAGVLGVAARGARAASPDLRRDPRWGGLGYFALQSGLRACWAEPIVGDGDGGRVLGTFALFSRRPELLGDADLNPLREAAQLAAIAVSRAQLYRRLERQAHYDALTGLPNRSLFGELLGRATGQAGTRGEGVGVLLVDLGSLKRVNDALGHRTGDLLLSAVAARLAEAAPATATLARGGGDEFVLALPLSERGDAARVAFELAERLAEPFEVAGRPFKLEASIGVSLYPEDGEGPETLLRAADAAMRAARSDRQAGRRQGYRLFQPEMSAELEAALRLEDDLRRALAGDELQLWLQGRFELGRAEPRAYEALVRWQHPERGLLSPGAFLGGAQRAGLLPQLDAWVLRAVVEQLRRWAADGRSWGLSCNVSAASFQSRAFLGALEEALGEGGAVATRLELEITENLLMQNLGDAAAQLAELKERFPGIRVAIDDFGSGYSSLAYLRHLPIDTLKIDRAFVQDLDHREGRLQRTALAVIRTVINLGRDLGFRIVAEGAETEGQLGMLTALGVDEVQGFVLGRPRPLAEAVAPPVQAASPSAELS